jgi:hypothetical protein
MKPILGFQTSSGRGNPCTLVLICVWDWVRDWRVLVLGLVAGDGSYVTALVIDVNLTGGRIWQ